jgi:hypothetical protein
MFHENSLLTTDDKPELALFLPSSHHLDPNFKEEFGPLIEGVDLKLSINATHLTRRITIKNNFSVPFELTSLAINSNDLRVDVALDSTNGVFFSSSLRIFENVTMNIRYPVSIFEKNISGAQKASIFFESFGVKIPMSLLLYDRKLTCQIQKENGDKVLGPCSKQYGINLNYGIVSIDEVRQRSKSANFIVFYFSRKLTLSI